MGNSFQRCQMAKFDPIVPPRPRPWRNPRRGRDQILPSGNAEMNYPLEANHSTNFYHVITAREGGGVGDVRGDGGDCARLGFGADRRDGGLLEFPREPRRRVSFGDFNLQ